MKKPVIILAIVLMLTFMLTSPVFATQPTYSQGTWDNFSEDPVNFDSTYEIHGLWEGTVFQPTKPGVAQKAYFEGTVDGIYGTCVLNVRTFNKQGVMSGAVLQCDGDLSGLQATFRGSFENFDPFWGYFESWHHFETKPPQD
jgi:hypothetical protein